MEGLGSLGFAKFVLSSLGLQPALVLKGLVLVLCSLSASLSFADFERFVRGGRRLGRSVVGEQLTVMDMDTTSRGCDGRHIS